MKKLLIVLSFVFSTTVFTQNTVEYIDFKTINDKISSYADKEEYDKIIETIDNVNKNDSIYSSLLITKSYYLLQLGKYKDAIKVTDEGFSIGNSDERLSFFINKALSYWYLEDYKNALNTIDDGLKEFPKSYELYYRKGWFYHKMDQYDDALKWYKKAMILNPFHADTHLKIGNICYKQHLITQALMCFNTYLLLNPDGEGAFTVLKSLNAALAQKNENKKIEGLIVSKDDEAFEDIDLILDNRVALSADYKIENEININYVKQNHALFQVLGNFNGNGGLWDTKYVKLHKWIAENNFFDDFVYTTTYSIKNEKLKKILEKKKDRVIAFFTKFKDKWSEIMEENEQVFRGKKQRVFSYFNNYILEGIGTDKEGTTLKGFWEFYDTKGRITGEGTFDANENKIGKWIWYYQDKTIKETAQYKNGKLEGENIGYYQNGKVKYKANYGNGLLIGAYRYYNEKGALNQLKYFKDNKLDGKFISYYEVGEPTTNFIVNYVNGNKEGHVIQYFPNGAKLFEVTFKGDKKNGKEKEYFNNETLMSEYPIIDDKINGDYKEYYNTGILSKEGNYQDNEYTGLWKMYYPDGKLMKEFSYKNGKLNDAYIEYAPNGKPYFEYTYRNDEIIGYKYYGQNGEVVKDVRKKGGEFFYEGYTYEGNKIAEGLYDVKGGKTGEWKYYTDNGVLSSKGTYKENLIQGEYTNYYNNGVVKSVDTYVNDTISGYSVNYHKNGKMESQGWFLKGKMHKEWRYYYLDGTLKSINFYHKGELHGEQQYFSIEGKLFSTLQYKYGKLLSEKSYDYNRKVLDEISHTNLKDDDTIISHYSTNKAFSKTTFKFGVRHGPYKAYDFYGNVLLEGQYFNNKASGVWKWYNTDKKVIKKATFLNGEYHGTVSYYYDNGNISRKYHYNLDKLEGMAYFYAEDGKTITGTTEFVNDEYHGRRIAYSKEGKLQLVRFYEYGRLIGFSYLDKNGNELPMIKIKNETAKIVTYFDNGNKAREMEFINGDDENEYKSYYYNGQLHVQYSNKNDEYDGTYFEYYPDGKLKEEIDYKDGELNGVYKKYYPNGKLKEKVHYKNDGKSGEATYYTPQGQLKKTEKYFNEYRYETTQF